MSASSDEYESADENAVDEKLSKPGTQTVHSDDLKTAVNKSNSGASSAQNQQPEVVKVLDNKYVSDAESLKSGGVVELTEEQRKVSTTLFSVVSIVAKYFVYTLDAIIIIIYTPDCSDILGFAIISGNWLCCLVNASHSIRQCNVVVSFTSESNY